MEKRAAGVTGRRTVSISLFPCCGLRSWRKSRSFCRRRISVPFWWMRRPGSDVETFAICLLRAIKAGKEFLIQCGQAQGDRKHKRQAAVRQAGSCWVQKRMRRQGKIRRIVLIGSHVKNNPAAGRIEKDPRPRRILEFNVNTCFRKAGWRRKPWGYQAEQESGRGDDRVKRWYTSRTLLPGRNERRRKS